MSVGGVVEGCAQPFISISPWFTGTQQRAMRGTRGFLWVPGDAESVILPEVGELQADGWVNDSEGRHWQRFELPHCHDPQVSELEIEIQNSGRTSRHTLNVVSSLPSRESLEEVAQLKSDGEDDEASDLLHACGFDERALGGIAVLNLIDRHADMMYRLGQTAHSFLPYLEYSSSERHYRSATRVCNRWERIGRSRTPPLSLIVRLAGEIPKTVEKVCESPRVVLSRVRELEQAARIHEVDQSCIRWLGRQPGRSLAQKAGNRQRLMAVVRKEDCDTPENRVVRDLLVRCRAAGRSYLARNTETEFEDHPRIKSVQRLVMLCEHYLQQSQIRDVRKLVGIAQPNYVLQHEQRYRVLWNAYIRLVRQEKVTQSVWQWRDRVWLEWLTMAIVTALKQLAFRSPGHRQTLGISDEPTTGRYIEAVTSGPWWLKADRTRSFSLVNCSGQTPSALPDWIARLQPDLALAESSRQGVSLAIWTTLDVTHPVDTAKQLAQQLEAALPSDQKVECRLLILVAGDISIQQGSLGKGVSWLTVPLMLQDSLESWKRIVSEYLCNA